MIKYIFISAITIPAFFLLPGCSSGGDVAGGTGTGNPSGGGHTVVAIVADTGTGSHAQPKAPASQKTDLPPLNLPIPEIPVTDDDSMEFLVKKATLRADAIYFILEDGQNCETLLAGHTHLHCDSNRIVLEGPFEFDLLSGTATPPIDSLLLPQADYLGMGLRIIEQDASADNPEHWPVHVSGTFDYMDEPHDFDIFTNAGDMSSYLTRDKSIKVQAGKTSRFILKLHTKNWLTHAGIRSCLDAGTIPLGPLGDLTITPDTGEGPCSGIENRIGLNIAGSGSADLSTLP